MAAQTFIETIEPSPAFASYFHLAAERHAIFLKRLRGEPGPWSNSPIFQKYKFTNAFRVLDRVSQFLLREVIYRPGLPTEPEEIIFRILLFKLFNSIGAWEALTAGLAGTPTWKGFDAARYGKILGQAKDAGVNLWNNAYTQKPQIDAELEWKLIEKGLPGKHRRYLAVLEHSMRSGVPEKLLAAKSYREAYEALLFPPLYGPFLSMQHLTDINYSTVINFDEDDFIMPGPGCRKGIAKCFNLPLSAVSVEDAQALITHLVEGQEDFFELYGYKEPITLFGRRLHAIDVQNCFCETEKFARIAHPELRLKEKETPPSALQANGAAPRARLSAKVGAGHFRLAGLSSGAPR